MAHLNSVAADLVGICCYNRILEIEENQRGALFRVEFTPMENALTVKSGLSN